MKDLPEFAYGWNHIILSPLVTHTTEGHNSVLSAPIRLHFARESNLGPSWDLNALTTALRIMIERKRERENCNGNENGGRVVIALGLILGGDACAGSGRVRVLVRMYQEFS